MNPISRGYNEISTVGCNGSSRGLASTFPCRKKNVENEEKDHRTLVQRVIAISSMATRRVCCTMVNQMFVILWISRECERSLSSNFVYTISVLVGRYSVCYIEKSLPLCRLDFFDRRHVCHPSRSGLWICNDAVAFRRSVFYFYSLTSFPQDLLKKSTEKKSSLSWPRPWAKDPGCTCRCKWEKVHESCGRSTEKMWVFSGLFYFSFANK